VNIEVILACLVLFLLGSALAWRQLQAFLYVEDEVD